MQSKRNSIIEAFSNVFSGMIIAFVISQLANVFEADIQRHIWKGFEWKVSAGSNAVMTILMTMLSIVRGYLWRRHFNNVQMKHYQGENHEG